MEIKEGYLYHIKEEFFDIINGEKLMINHEKGRSRPTYYVIKDNEILWFIPLSSKVDKYKPIVKQKIEKHGRCNSILIAKIGNKESAILLQNAFPTLEKYISHQHMINGNPLKVINALKIKIFENFKNMLILKEEGTNLFFTDIDKIKEQMLKELEKDKQKEIVNN